MDLRTRIRERRSALGWSQRQLAERAEISLRTVARLELEDREPDTATLQRVADALGGDLAGLLRESESAWLADLRRALDGAPLGPQARRSLLALVQIARVDLDEAERAASEMLGGLERRRARQRVRLEQQLRHSRGA